MASAALHPDFDAALESLRAAYPHGSFSIGATGNRVGRWGVTLHRFGMCVIAVDETPAAAFADASRQMAERCPDEMTAARTRLAQAQRNLEAAQAAVDAQEAA